MKGCAVPLFGMQHALNLQPVSQTMDETGLVVAGCHHVVALKAVNMFAGEQYGYALYLHRALSSKWNMQFVWQDIMCKYWPWLERLCEKMPELSQLLSNRKAFSVMHAKGHSLDCQVHILLLSIMHRLKA